MKKTHGFMSLIVCAATLVLAISLTSCSNDDDSSSSNEPTLVTSAYEVGKMVTFANEKYYVVSNTISSASRNAVRAADDSVDVSELVKSESIARATKFTEDYFGSHILLLRISGKVMVPNGKTSEYQDAYAAAEKAALESLSATDAANETKKKNAIKNYFAEDTDTTKNAFSYTDNYKVLNSSEEELGSCLIVWDSGTNTKFEGEKTLSELIAACAFDTIRKSLPGQCKIREKLVRNGKNYEYEVIDHKLWDSNGKASQLEPAPNSLYFYEDKSIVKSATLQNKWTSEGGAWESAYLDLTSVLGLNSTGTGIQLQVRKKNGDYQYQILGSAKNGTTRYKTDSKNFNFTDKTFKADNVVIPADATGLYISASENTNYTHLTYDEQTLSVPIEFILNDDGSVSYGESVFAWVKHWRDYIVENNDEATAF